MNAQMDKEAGLYTQIRTLRKRIDSLDMSKVDPSELKAAIDSLKDLETRYADMQEKKKQRSLEKQNKEKELSQQKESAPVVDPNYPDMNISPFNPTDICGCGHSLPDHDFAGGSKLCNICQDSHVFTPKAQEVTAAPTDEPAPQPIPQIDTKPEDMEPKKAEESKPKEKLEKKDLTKDPEFDSMMASALYMKMLDYLIMADDPQYETIVKFRRAIERIQNEEDREKLQAIFNKEFAINQQTPWDYYAEAKKETEIKPEATTEKKADVAKFALDDLVEPVYGTAGSYGRVMRYDADKDLAYVHWDSGKLATDHGFGAYKGSDLRKRAFAEKLAKVAFLQKTAKQFELLVGKYVELDAKNAQEAMAKAKEMFPNLEIEEVAKQMGDEVNRKFKLVYKKKAFLVRKGTKFMVYMTNVVPVDAPTEHDAMEKARQMYPGIDQVKLNNAPNFGDFEEVVEPEQNEVPIPVPVKKRMPRQKVVNPTSSLNIEARVVERSDGWHVLSEEGKNLGGPYKSKEQAVKRLRQVEYFKHHKGSFKFADGEGYPHAIPEVGEEWMNKALDEIENGSERAYDLAAEYGQHFDNVKHMKWFIQRLAEEIWYDETDGAMSKPADMSTADPLENPGEGYGGDRPGVAVEPKAVQASSKEAAKINVANRLWEIVPRYELVGDRTKLIGYEIIADTGEKAGFIKTNQPLNQAVIEQEIWNKLNESGAVRATLNTNLSVLKKGHKVKIVSVDVKRKEAKFASLDMKSITGWTSIDRFDFTVEAGTRDHIGEELMPLSKSNVVRIKSYKLINELAEKCPDCYKKFLKFAQEKGLRIQADDLTDHVEQVRTRINQNKEMLQNQSQASSAPESLETEAALPPKPNVTLQPGFRWFFNDATNTWEMIADEKFTGLPQS